MLRVLRTVIFRSPLFPISQPSCFASNGTIRRPAGHLEIEQSCFSLGAVPLAAVEIWPIAFVGVIRPAAVLEARATPKVVAVLAFLGAAHQWLGTQRTGVA